MHRRRAERKLVCRIGRSHRDDSLFSFPTYEFRRRAGEVLSEGSEPQEFVNSVCNAGEEGSLEITDRRAGRRERERGGKETERAASCDIFVSARSGGTPVSLMTVHTNNQ